MRIFFLYHNNCDTLIFFIRTMVLNKKNLKFFKKIRTQHSKKNRWFLFGVNFWVETRTTVKIRTIISLTLYYTLVLSAWRIIIQKVPWNWYFWADFFCAFSQGYRLASKMVFKAPNASNLFFWAFIFEISWKKLGSREYSLSKND